MKIACPACAAKYSIADEKVRNRLAKIRCRKCGNTIVIDGKVDPPQVQGSSGTGVGASYSVPPPAGGSVAPASAESEYSVDLGDNDQRSMTLSQIVVAYNDGTLTADSYVWKDGMDDWAALADVPEISDALHAAASRASSAPVAARVAASPSDIFGRIAQAGSEYDVTTSAPAPAEQNVATGARNESSVLFSLSSLTSADASAGRSTTTAASSEDSGLIDLAALTGGPVSGSDPHAAPPMGFGLGASPLAGASAPLGHTPSAIQIPADMPQSGNKNGLFIGGGIAVAAIVGAIAYVMGSGGSAPDVATASPTATATAAIQPEGRPAAEEKEKEDEKAKAKEKEKEDEEEEAEEKKASDAPKTRSTGRRPTSSAKSSSAKSSSASSSPSPAPAAKSEDGAKKKKKPNKCDCKPSDSMCAMRCSAK